MTKRALVFGAGGFIGHHLVKRLKLKDYWVRAVDRKGPEFSETKADEFIIKDLRDPQVCRDVMSGGFDELYQLAADMGGMGFIASSECDIMRNSALININALHAAKVAGVSRYFFSSSVCVYPNMKPGDHSIPEERVYPAMPDNEYGWEKLYAERMALAYGRRYDMAVRIARFQNCYGPEGTWQGGREKAPAALLRKVAEAEDGGTIEVWGDGTAVRSYTYIEDIIEGIRCLMRSNLERPANIGSREYVTVDQLVKTIIDVSGKKINIKYIKGPVGVESRNFRNTKICSTGWRDKFFLRDGIALTYPWIVSQVEKDKRSKQ